MKNGAGERAKCMGDSSVVMHYAILIADPAGSIARWRGCYCEGIALPLQYSTLLGREGRGLPTGSLNTGRHLFACFGVDTQLQALVALLVGSGANGRIRDSALAACLRRVGSTLTAGIHLLLAMACILLKILVQVFIDPAVCLRFGYRKV